MRVGILNFLGDELVFSFDVSSYFTEYRVTRFAIRHIPFQVGEWRVSKNLLY